MWRAGSNTRPSMRSASGRRVFVLSSRKAAQRNRCGRRLSSASKLTKTTNASAGQPLQLPNRSRRTRARQKNHHRVGQQAGPDRLQYLAPAHQLRRKRQRHGDGHPARLLKSRVERSERAELRWRHSLELCAGYGEFNPDLGCNLGSVFRPCCDRSLSYDRQTGAIGQDAVR